MGSLTLMRFVMIAAITAAIANAKIWASTEIKPAVARIAGVVVDESGAAVPGAEVYAGEDREDSTLTDKEGKFLLELKHSDHASVGYHNVVASAEGGRRLGVWSIQDVFEPKIEGKMVLKPSWELCVKVTDATNTPIANAEVAAGFEEMYGEFTAGKTDASGNAKLWIWGGGKLAWVAAVKHGAGLDYIHGENVAPGKRGKSANVELKLAGAQKFIIEAKDSQDRFVSGVEFFPWLLTKADKPKALESRSEINLSGAIRALPSLVSKTDAQGQAVVDWMPPDVTGKVPFECHGEVWHNPVEPVYDPEKPKEPLSIKLLANIELSGKVLFPDGKPAADIIVQAEGRGETNNYCRTRAQTAADGGFTVNLYPDQNYVITVVHKTWAVDSVTGLKLSEGDTPADVTLRLKKGTRVHGTLPPDARFPFRMGEVIVDQVNGNGSLIRWPDVDAAGHYEIFLGRGTYRFQMSRPNSPEHLVVVMEQPELEVNF